jgi:hypothetical protein
MELLDVIPGYGSRSACSDEFIFEIILRASVNPNLLIYSLVPSTPLPKQKPLRYAPLQSHRIYLAVVSAPKTPELPVPRPATAMRPHVRAAASQSSSSSTSPSSRTASVGR